MISVEHKKFEEHVAKAAEKLRNTDRKETIRIISHLDADGICSSSIVLSALCMEGFMHHLSIVRQLSETIIKELSKENYNTYIFTDLGSGQYDLILKYLSQKTIIILDHHSFDTAMLDNMHPSMTFVNPHAFGINGSSEISGSGVAYLFAEALNEKNRSL